MVSHPKHEHSFTLTGRNTMEFHKFLKKNGLKHNRFRDTFVFLNANELKQGQEMYKQMVKKK